MRKKISNPFICFYGFKKTNLEGYSFILPGKELIIQGANDVIDEILSLCNGYNSIDIIINKVSNKTKYSRADIKSVINILIEKEIIVDAREQYLVFHRISSNPMPYLHPLTTEYIRKILNTKSHLIEPQTAKRSYLENLFEKRESTRKFSGEPFSYSDFINLAWAMYGKISRSKDFPSKIGLGTVPSGGALYSLRVYSIVVNVASLEKFGVYNLRASECKLIKKINLKELNRVFKKSPPPVDLNKIAAIYILTSEFKHTTQKYSNRGYRLALLEAGHAAQNAYLWGAENDKGVLEFGGFNDEELSNVLDIKFPSKAPLTILIVGHKDEKKGFVKR